MTGNQVCLLGKTAEEEEGKEEDEKRRKEKRREERRNQKGKGREMRVCDVGSAMTTLQIDFS
jgi:hypothetical protein